MNSDTYYTGILRMKAKIKMDDTPMLSQPGCLHLSDDLFQLRYRQLMLNHKSDFIFRVPIAQ